MRRRENPVVLHVHGDACDLVDELFSLGYTNRVPHDLSLIGDRLRPKLVLNEAHSILQRHYVLVF